LLESCSSLRWYRSPRTRPLLPPIHRTSAPGPVSANPAASAACMEPSSSAASITRAWICPSPGPCLLDPFGSDPDPAAPRCVPWSERTRLISPQGNALTCGCPIPSPGCWLPPKPSCTPLPGLVLHPPAASPGGPWPVCQPGEDAAGAMAGSWHLALPARPPAGPRCPFGEGLWRPSGMFPAGPRCRLTKLALCSLTYGSIYSTLSRELRWLPPRCESAVAGTKLLSPRPGSGQGTALLLPRSNRGVPSRSSPATPRGVCTAAGCGLAWHGGGLLLVNDALPLPPGTELSWAAWLAVPRLFRAPHSHQKPIGCQIRS